MGAFQVAYTGLPLSAAAYIISGMLPTIWRGCVGVNKGVCVACGAYLERYGISENPTFNTSIKAKGGGRFPYLFADTILH